MSQSLSIHIVNYNTKEYLRTCLESLYRDLVGCDFSYSVHVLDNASGDVLADLLVDYPDLHLSKSQHNDGFGAGHNQLFAQTSSDIVLILNPDTIIIQKETIKSLVKTLEQSGASIVGPALIDMKGNVQKNDHGELLGFRALIARLACEMYWRERNELVPVAWVSGGAFLVTREVITTIGGFDENFFLYKEEEDFCLRARKLGYGVVYDPRIRVQHISGVVASPSKHIEKSIVYFRSKHSPPKLLFRVALWLHYFLKKKFSS